MAEHTDLKELVAFCDQYLEADKIKDYCPNGLQVEGRPEVSRILGGVTASQALLDEAVAGNYDAILVHHGYFWKGESERVVGIKRQRLKTLLQNDISLIAYHLPLDVHPEVGNNVELASILGIEIEGGLDPAAKSSIALKGQLKQPQTAAEFGRHIEQVLGRAALHIGDQDAMIKNIGWCTGAAQGMISQAVAAGVDAYLSGEISEPTVHIARESGVQYFSAGHHATERYGVQALGKKLVEMFGLQFEFVDVDNPV